ncbi:MAG: hypothetical protein E7534_02755 [Ruminococcaceae bacterium]|nr:hypothetical protein [Oscillospiraceae bacterium]
MKHLILSIALCLCMLAGCVPAEPTPNPPDAPALQVYREQYASRRGFLSLSAAQQQNYDALFTAVTEQTDSDTFITIDQSGRQTLGLRVTLPAPLTQAEEIATLFAAFLGDNPAFFYIDNTYTYEGYRVGDAYRYNALCLSFTMNAAERKTAQAQIDAALATLTAGAAALPQGERAVLLHDRLIAHATYDEQAAESDTPDKTHPFAFTVYGALVQQKAVCEGYARAYMLLCQLADIPCATVGGTETATNGPHMWNIVTIDGADYHTDVTWDDRWDTALHVYCHLTAEEIGRTHTFDKDAWGQTADATAENWYIKNDRYQPRYDRTAIAKAIAARVAVGDAVIEWRFSPEHLSSIALFVKNRTWFSEAVEEHLPDGVKMWEYDSLFFKENGVMVLKKK